MSTATDLCQQMLDPITLQQACQQAKNPALEIKRALKRCSEQLDRHFREEESIETLVRARALITDRLLQALWQSIAWPAPDEISLIAVGGYGRGELHPHSDIDLLILTSETGVDSNRSAIEQLVTLLWDTGMAIGHSVRTVSACVEEAAGDITVATNLIESRLLTGPGQWFEAMLQATQPNRVWNSRDFFRAKWEEQIARHRKYANTEYNLEPNLKASPGGLRDIQMIGWVTRRHYETQDYQDLVTRGFLLPEELDILLSGRAFLWRVRYALHMMTGRAEDRLLFEHQKTLAELFDYHDDDARLAVERFMQQYYRWTIALSELNEVLMQHFDEDILRACEPETTLEINQRFRVRNGYLEVANDKVFQRNPSALLEVFVILAQNPHIQGVRASTIRLIRQHRELVDDTFRADLRNRQLFIELLRSQHLITTQLRRMSRYGILGKYLPEFGKIIGQMQHDLFHIYTVDAHTLEVIKNMRRFQYKEFEERFPVASRVLRRLPKLELLYIAGLYHDIGKGRGGDHSKLGADDARQFCEHHGFNRRDTNLVGWLVENHLLMSSVAQRRDISDPSVINEFAREVGDLPRLDYLYTLTVADITATNPNLWNAWRASLLRQLYAETKRALRRGLEKPIDHQEWIAETQQAAIERLEALGYTETQVRDLWGSTGEDYFLREKVDDVVWHTLAISQHAGHSEPLVLIKESSELQFEGATQIFIHAPDTDYLFAAVAVVLDKLDLNIQDARIYNSDTGFVLDTFFVLEADGTPIGDNPARTEQIRQELMFMLAEPDQYPELVRRRTPRVLKHFATPTEANIYQDLKAGMTVLEVLTPDRPGLLARIGQIFLEFQIELHNAKIATLGERVEDMFFITDQHHKMITDPDLCRAIVTAIKQQLDAQVGL